MQWLQKILADLFFRDLATQKLNGIKYKKAFTLLLLILALFVFVISILSLVLMPGHSTVHYALIVLSIVSGVFLYFGGLVLSIVAFKKAHYLFHNPDDDWSGSVAAS